MADWQRVDNGLINVWWPVCSCPASHANARSESRNSPLIAWLQPEYREHFSQYPKTRPRIQKTYYKTSIFFSSENQNTSTTNQIIQRPRQFTKRTWSVKKNKTKKTKNTKNKEHKRRNETKRFFFTFLKFENVTGQMCSPWWTCLVLQFHIE